MSLFAELKRRHVVRVAVSYAVVGWVIAQVAEFAFETFEAPSWVLQALVVVLLLGLPISMILAWAFELTPEGIKRDSETARKGPPEEIDPNDVSAGQIPDANPVPRRRFSILIVVILVFAAIAYFGFDRWQQNQQYESALVKLETARELNLQDRYGEAFIIAQHIKPLMGDSSEFDVLWEEITADIRPRIAQEGVAVSFRPYESWDAPWTPVGTTPLQLSKAPKGILLMRLEKEGYVTREFAVANPGPMLGNVPPKFAALSNFPMPKLELHEQGKLPEELVQVPATHMPVFLQGITVSTLGGLQRTLPEFAVAKHEVSNREFKAFVDDDAYANHSWWTGLKLPDGSPLTEELIAGFVDSTGRPGPANWELGNFPAGAGDLPVGGLSLYEAKAYARYKGLALPTLHHWARYSHAPLEGIMQTAPAISRASNFDPSGPIPVDQGAGIGPWGTINSAGNAREWVWNATGKLAFAMGGSWSDYESIFQDSYTIEPMDRSAQNGMRLIHMLGEPIDSSLLEPIAMNWDIQHRVREPVNDDVFEAMRFQFTHVRRTPTSVNVEILEQNDTWIAEEVILRFASDDEMTLYVVRPSDSTGKLEPILYMPHGGGIEKIPNRELLTHVPYLDFIVRAGRALVIPVWERSAQRYSESPKNPDERADWSRRVALAWHKDAATTIDYLETREDMNTAGVGFIGNSFGAYRSSVFLATEARFTAAVLIAGGAPYWDIPHPMGDPVNYFPRMTLPVLMINGRYDHIFLYENSQKRLFDLLGTAPEDKRQLLFDKGHFDFPRNQVALEVSNWFDKYLVREK